MSLAYKRVGTLVAAVIGLAASSLAHAGGIPPLPKLPPLPDQQRWEEAIARFSRDADPKLAANKRLVLNAELGFAQSLRYGHTKEIFEHYLSPNYIQHDPNIPPGRDGLRRWFEAGAMQPDPKAGEERSKSGAIPIMVLADDDKVVLTFESTVPDPTDPSKTYVYMPVAIFRVENGQVAEHWGGSPKGAIYCRLDVCKPKM